MLLNKENQYNPNEIDTYGHSPLSLCLKGPIASGLYYNLGALSDNMFLALVKAGADVNIVYPEETYRPAFTEEEVDDMNYKTGKTDYRCTILIHTIRQNAKFKDIMRKNILGLFQHGVTLNIVDSDGRDAMMHAIILNNKDLVQLLLDNKDQGQLNLSIKDKSGKTPVHYVVNPIKFGSYENVEILQLLFKAGYNVNVKDNDNKAPIQYAQEQESGVLLNEFIKMLKLDKASLQKF